MAKITAPQAGYNGRSVGVEFVDGVGETDSEAAIAYFERQGYTVEGSSDDAGIEEETTEEVVDPLATAYVDPDLGAERDAADPRNDSIPVGGVKADGLIVAGKGKGRKVSASQAAPKPEAGSVLAPVQETSDPANQSANPSGPNPPEAVTPTAVPTDVATGEDKPETPAPASGDLKADTSADASSAPATDTTTKEA